MEALHQVTAVEALDATRLRVQFDTGEVGVFDCTPYMREKFWQRLNEREYFKLVRVECGMLCWPGDEDIAPEDVWQYAVK